MTNKAIVFLLIVSSGNGFSQNQMQQQFSNIGLTNHSVMQQQRNNIFASNVANTNKQQRQASQQMINQNVNLPVKNLNVDMSMQSNAAENNVGNEMNNFQQIQVQLLTTIAAPQSQLANGKAFDLKLPSLNIGMRKTIRRTSSEGSSVKHKLMVIENKFKKVNRKLSARLSFKKKLKMKVDNCFKW